MGRKSVSGGVNPKGKGRIEYTFFYKGERFRPTVERPPTEANLRRARVQLQAIKEKIEAGTFNFREEFPEYRYQHKLPEAKPEPLPQPKLTCDQVFDAYLAHCEMRVDMNDMAHSTLGDYRRILKSVWRSQIGNDLFESIVYSRLAGILAKHTRNKKTYNNIASAIRCAFAYGYKDHPEKHNPASGLTTFRISKKDRLPIDPFSIEEAERVIAESHQEFGQAHGNFEEFRFFTGLRQSEQFALLTSDCDLVKGRIKITKARVRGQEKDRTKTREDREIQLCGRALEVLKRQMALRERFIAAGRIDHDFVFFQEDGTPIFNLSYPHDRWRFVFEKTQLRYREPYNARHSYISWRLMAGHNVLLVAKEDGHSPTTMLATYAAWITGSTEEDVEATKAAIERSPSVLLSQDGECPQKTPEGPRICHQFATRGALPPPREGYGRLSWRKHKQNSLEKWRSGREPQSHCKLLKLKYLFPTSATESPQTCSRKRLAVHGA